MPTSGRLSLLLALVVGAGALGAASASAAPSNGSGTVLSLGGHTVRLVDKAHRVGDVHVSSTRGLRRGDVVRVQHGRARVNGHARRVTFLGRVVRSSGRGAVLRLGDGSTFKLAGGHRSPGQTLLITIATGRGAAVVSVRPASAGTRGGRDDTRGGSRGDDDACNADASDADDDACSDDDSGADDDWSDEADGTVTALADNRSSLTIALDDGSGEQTYPVDDPSLLDEIAVGDEVAVYLDEDGTALDVELLDWSDDDPGPGDDGGDDDEGDE